MPGKKLSVLTRKQKANVKQYVDQDYWNALSAEEKEFLNKFNAEYYNGSALHSESALHNSSSLRKKARENKKTIRDDANLVFQDNVPDNALVSPSPENALIEAIDQKRKKDSE